jgi:hypothetical protein
MECAVLLLPADDREAARRFDADGLDTIFVVGPRSPHA